MEITQVIETRRTIHNYTGEAVNLEIVKEALKLSLLAPNHKLTFPWHYSIGQKKAIAEIANLAVKIKKQAPDFSEIKKKALLDRFNSASYLIGLFQKKSENEDQNKENYATMACSVQNISLYLWSKGIGTKWSTGRVAMNEENYKIFRVDPNQFEILGFLWVGIPSRIPGLKQRPELSEVLTIVE